MPKPFYKHKILLDEQLYHRHLYPKLNQHFDVKHIKLDLRQGGIDDAPVHELAVKQGRIILTSNVKDFRSLIHNKTPGVIGIPDAWPAFRVDKKITALLMKHSPAYFRGRYISLATETTSSIN